MVSREEGWAFLREEIQARLDTLRTKHRHRSLTPAPAPGDGMIDLTHNDYLGLRTDPDHRRRMRELMEELPSGSGGSRLLGGNHPVFARLEEAFATFRGSRAALYFSSGYQANEAIAAALSRHLTCFIADEASHASIIDGQHQSPLPRAKRLRFRHNDTAHLEEILRASTARLNVIFVEGLHSMEGDFCPLSPMQELAEAHRGVLVVDEAHSLGCTGPGGRGMVDRHSRILTVNPCGKALGSQGALIAGPEWLQEYLINTSRKFIYTTAPSPMTAAALLAGLELLPRLDERRHHLQTVATGLRTALQNAGFDTGLSDSHIIPVIIGDEARTLHMQRLLAQDGFLLQAVRPPTVPSGTARLRLSVNSGITSEVAGQLVTALVRARSLA